MCSPILHQNMCAILQFPLDLLLSRCWIVSMPFSTFYTTDSKWIVRNPPPFENVYLTLYDIIMRAIREKQADIIHIVFPIITVSDSWAWINRPEVFQSANYAAFHTLRWASCIVHTNCQPRFFSENVSEIVSRFVAQHSVNIWMKMWEKRHYYEKSTSLGRWNGRGRGVCWAGGGGGRFRFTDLKRKPWY